MNALQTLMHILSIARPAYSVAEDQFVDWLESQLPNPTSDDYGNLHVKIGQSETIFSCHTDTVAAKGGEQLIAETNGVIHLVDGKPGQSLGADDGAGIWLMLQMIKAEVPGWYIFHRDEEVGGKGSRYLADKHPDWFDGYHRAVAFDRRGLGDVITHQAGGRCASDEFAQALADQLGYPYKPSSAGIFTDTANYTRLIAECSNISVGYENEHGPRETLDLNHVLTLSTTLIGVEWETLPTIRDPKVVEMRSYGQLDLYRGTGKSLEDAIIDRRKQLVTYFEHEGILDGDDLEAMLDEYFWEAADVG